MRVFVMMMTFAALAVLSFGVRTAAAAPYYCEISTSGVVSCWKNNGQPCVVSTYPVVSVDCRKQ